MRRVQESSVRAVLLLPSETLDCETGSLLVAESVPLPDSALAVRGRGGRRSSSADLTTQRDRLSTRSRSGIDESFLDENLEGAQGTSQVDANKLHVRAADALGARSGPARDFAGSKRTSFCNHPRMDVWRR
jgi:hypothetical protein